MIELNLISGFGSPKAEVSDPVGLRVHLEKDEEKNYLICVNELFYNNGFTYNNNGVYLNLDEAKALHGLLSMVIESGKVETPKWQS